MYPAAQSFCKRRNNCRSWFRQLIARSGFYLRRAQRIAGNIESRQDSLRSRPPVKRSSGNRAFLPFAGSCRVISALFAGNLSHPLEIQKIRWKMKFRAGK
jgi:hypothetical protein